VAPRRPESDVFPRAIPQTVGGAFFTINVDQASIPAQFLWRRFTVARSIIVQALIDGEPVGQVTARCSCLPPSSTGARGRVPLGTELQLDAGRRRSCRSSPYPALTHLWESASHSLQSGSV
jgi:hypothetical protein